MNWREEGEARDFSRRGNDWREAERRSRFEMHMEVMHAVFMGHHKVTHIMYKANLSHGVLSECLTYLEEKGMLITRWHNAYASMERESVSLSARGGEVLDAYLKLRTSIEPEYRIVWHGETR